MGHGPHPQFRVYAEVAPHDHPGTDERFGYIASAMRPGTQEHAERIEREHAEAVSIIEKRRSGQAEADEQQRQTWGYEVTP